MRAAQPPTMRNGCWDSTPHGSSATWGGSRRSRHGWPGARRWAAAGSSRSTAVPAASRRSLAGTGAPRYRRTAIGPVPEEEMVVPEEPDTLYQEMTEAATALLEGRPRTRRE